MRDTIFALATAPGRAAVAVMRVSGPGAGACLDQLCGSRPPPRRASVRLLADPESGEALDQALVIWSPGPASFTGDDVVELQLHGGPAIVDAVADALAAAGARPAEAGEFTRRAFEAGRLELSQAEAIADLVDAETTAQRRQALAQLGGALARRYEGWRARLIEAMALLEAEIDFPDEELPEDLARQAFGPLRVLRGEIAEAIRDVRGERVRDGFRIAIIGAPNAGKSSLFNGLVRRDAAIVTATPGTTRDVIEASMTIAGYAVVLADTAGVREAGDAIEAEGVRRARAWADDAALRLWVVDHNGEGGDWREGADLARPGDILVLNKIDLLPGPDREAVSHVAAELDLDVVAAAAGKDVSAIRAAVERRVVQSMAGADAPAVTRVRHRALLAEALRHLDRALSDEAAGAELLAESVRLAARELERISGHIDSEAILDHVFGAFCIGK